MGPFTPEYLAGGVEKYIFDPPTVGSPQEIFFRVTGHGLPPDGRIYKRKYDESMRNFTNIIYLTAEGVRF